MSTQPSGPAGTAAKTERLLNVVIALLATRRPLSKAQLRSAVPQYQHTGSVEAFDRMFERDKEDLRDLGIPLSTVADPLAPDELGYRIDRREYALPDLAFTPAELAALAVAGRVWTTASLAAPATAAVAKLSSAGVAMDDASVVGLEPRVRTTEAAFDPVKQALVARQEIAFDYRKPDGTVLPRRVRPWGLTHQRGRWYLTGFDVDRDAERVFRLGRIDGPVRTLGRAAAYEIPADHVPRVVVSRVDADAPPIDQPPAILRVRVGAGNSLRRRARTVGEIDEDWSLIDVDYQDPQALAQEVAGFGPDVLVEAPDAVRDRVVALLRAAAAAHRTTAAGAPGVPAGMP